MSLTDRLFGRTAAVRLDLAAVQARFVEAVRRGGPPDADLARARLADACRDAGLDPVLPEEFDAQAAGLDADGLRRLAVLVAGLEVEDVREALPRLADARPMAELVAAAFTGLARETPLLTADVLGQSPLRVEELARRFLAALGALVHGESAEVSRKRLDRLDYGRLLAEAEAARQAAAGRVEQLRQMQEEQDRQRPRRGKW